MAAQPASARAEGECTSPMFEDVFTYKEYVPLDATSSSYTIGGLTNCVDENACGQITLGQEVRLCCAAQALSRLSRGTHAPWLLRSSTWGRVRRKAGT